MPAGRPSPFSPDLAAVAERLCRNGATDTEVAEVLGICVRTFYRWRARHDAFRAAIVLAKEAADDRVERALYQRAVGYDYRAEKVVCPRGGKPVAVAHRAHVPADVRAALHWLAIRRPQPWAGTTDASKPDIATIIAEARLRVARDSDMQREAASRAARHDREAEG